MDGSPLRRTVRGGRLTGAVLLIALTALFGLKAAGLAGAAGLSFQVNSTADAVDASVGNGVCRTSVGTCTLRAAIQETNSRPGADAIHVPAGTFALAIPPGSGQDSATGDLDITDSVVISGAGAASTIVDGGTPPAGSPPEHRGLDRLFEIAVDGGAVTLSGLTVSDGYAADYGGAILNSGTAAIAIVDSVVTGSAAGKTGGAIDNHGGGTVVVLSSTLSQNYAVEGGSALNNNLNGLVELTDSTVSGNSAAVVGLDETLRGAGAIANNAEHDEVGTIVVTGSQIFNNHAGGGHSGAGIWNKGTGRVTVDRTTFSKNGTDADGGAIYSGPGEVTVTNSTFSENSANNGGAISSGGSLTVLDSVFTKNAGADWGGGVHNFNLGDVTIRSSSFSENSALSGGGFANEGSGLVTVESSAFTKNIAVVSAVLDSGDGGGMHSNSGGEVVVTDVTFTENRARGGGGLSNGGGGVVRIARTLFSANTAEERGGGLLVEGGDVRMVDIDVVGNISKSLEEGGGGISFAGDKSASVGESAAIEQSRIRDNKTDGEGGGIDSRGDGPFAITMTSITGNTAAIGGALHHVGDAPLLVSRSTLSRNLAEHGGGVFVDGDGEANVENSTVSGNRAGQFGGGLLVSSRVAVRSSTVADNNAPSGGGINNGGGDLGDGLVFLANTIVANNPTGGNCAGTITSLDGNLENTNTCQLAQPGDQPDTAPLLGALADNGGPTQTHALLDGSPAQDAAVCTEVEPCPAVDQRGVARPQFAGHDVGAYESELLPGGDPALPPPGECPKFPNSLSAEADSWITQGSPASNSGTDSTLKVKSQSGSNSRALVRFSLPPLPDGCTTIASAVLRLEAASAKEGRTLSALQAAGAWTETGVTWNNQPATTGPAATMPSGQGTLEWDVTAQTLGSYVSGNHGYVIRDLAENGVGDEQSLSSREKPTDGPPELLLVFDDSTPETAIDEGPASPTAGRDAMFSFSSDASDATFECSLDGAAFAPCLPPQTLRDVTEGTHRLEVRATRRIRAVDPSPASYEWTVDLTAPVAAIAGGPADPTNETSAAVTFTASDNLDEASQLRYQCRLDGPGSAWSECANPARYERLGEGGHSVEVRAIDRVGNVGAPAVHAWTIDLTAPETAIDSGPADPSNSPSAEFAFSADEDATFVCALESAPFEPCPEAYGGLSEGAHVLEVRAVDRAGNVDPDPAVYRWTVDLTAPATAINAGPVDPSNRTSAEFAFSASEPAAFACSLDGAPYAPCGSPQSYAGLGEGSHTFDVGAIDRAGNVDPTPARAIWTIDLTPPESSIVERPADPTASTSARFVFSANENASFECRLDGGVFVACPGPASYEGLAEGRHSFDVRATDAAGNLEPSAARAEWTVDLTAPETAIDSGPADPSNSSSAEFEFSASEEATFVCSLDGGPFVDCSSARRYEGLSEGAHSFEVRGIDRAGNVDPSAAAFAWAIDLTPPETEIDSGPADPTNSSSAELAFSADDAARFECRLDGGDFAACSSPRTYSGLAEGGHAVDVRAIDGAGNVDPSPARFSWTVDLTPPETTIGEHPGDPTSETSASIAFSADESATFECRLDGAAFSTCSSPASYDALREGRHTFEVRATDRAGNVEPGPATAEWTIDLTPPQTSIDSGPPDPSNSTSAEFSFSADEEATFSCSLDGAPFAACSSRYEGLGEGAHTLEVRGTDRAGNVDGSPALYSWTIDLTPPDTRIDSGPADPTASTFASFAFSADEAASFECRLDGGPFTACSSRQSYESLGEGAHAFDVRAIDRAGNVDSSAARYSWTIDLTPPDTEIDSGPADPTKVSVAAFSFSADEEAAFECSLDGVPFTACSGAQSYEDLAEGRHSFAVRAIDVVGNVDSTPATHAWTVDQTPPDTTVESGARDPTNEVSASFTFAAGELGSTFECSLDDAPFASCASPAGYSGLAAGEHTFRVRATDRAGNTDSTPAAASWTIDLSPPQTTVVSGPPDPTNSTSVEFRFSADEAASFECRLDGGSFAACVSPALYEGLGEGVHAFDVRAVDAAGNADTTPVRSSWTIDLTPPQATIDSGPADPTNSATARFTFSADEAASFQCRLDGAPFTACSSEHVYVGLAEGLHTFEVRAIDRAGNADPSPAAYSWTIDQTAPQTTIDSGPPATTTSTSATFRFSASEAGSTFECSLDGAAFAACTSPRSYDALALGGHEFSVRATDAAANMDASPAVSSWTIEGNDTTAPDTTIDFGPPATSSSTSASFDFSASESGSTFECSLDGAAFAGCAPPRPYTDLANGSHQFRVRARDSAGNLDSTPATHSWTIDTVAPDTTITETPSALTSGTTASFSFSSNEAGSFECSLDGAAFAACASPREYSGLADGGHQFRVRARDGAGNADVTPAAHSWTIDTAAPDTTITEAPPATTTNTSASFYFSASEPGSTLECSLDGAAFTACASPRQYTGLAVGAHQFRVRARDAAGNLDASSATHSWTISAPSSTCPAPITLTAVADAWIDENSASSNKGDDSILKVQSKGPRDNFRALVRFTLPPLPQGCVLDTATLRLYAASMKPGRVLQALRLASGWTENGVSWSNQPATTGAGATTPSGSGYREWDVRSQVQAMFGEGVSHGFLIRDAVEGADAEQQFHSREKGETPPQLVIAFGP